MVIPELVEPAPLRPHVIGDQRVPGSGHRHRLRQPGDGQPGAGVVGHLHVQPAPAAGVDVQPDQVRPSHREDARRLALDAQEHVAAEKRVGHRQQHDTEIDQQHRPDEARLDRGHRPEEQR
jgi:hypothetical protein